MADLQKPSADEEETAAMKEEQASQAPVKPLDDLTADDFRKLGLPIPGGTQKVDGEGSTLDEDIFSLEQAFSPLAQAKKIRENTAYERCLRSLLIELKWPGEERHIVQALPHFRDLDDIHSFQATLLHLGFQSRVVTEKSTTLSRRLPCLIVDDEARPIIGLRLLENGKLLAYDGPQGDVREIDVPDGTMKLCIVQQNEQPTVQPRNSKISWFYAGLRKFNNQIWLVVGLTFFANLLALATPIYTMNVYNRVIGSKSLDTLVFFVLAILITLCFEIYIRSVRGRLIAYVGARFNTQLLIRGFERILNLPIAMTESASVSQQIVRLRQFENVQSFFSGPLVSAILDVPFTIVFVIAISLIHPVLSIIPIVLAVAFAIIAMFSMPMTKRNVLTMGKSRQENQNLLIETVNKRETLRQLRAEDVWIKRWEDVGQQYNIRRFNTQFFDTIMHTVAQSLVMIAGIVTLWAGSHLVMEEALSVGGLIAVMMFVWRVLSPIQTAFLSLNRVGQFAETARQADLLMSLPPERDLGSAPTLRRNFEGEIALDGVSFRYGASGDPVFRGLALEIPAGQTVAITGDAASGKTTLLKLILGLYRPQGGTVFIDGLNLQQLDVDEVRTSIGYAGQRAEFFYGTVAQNIRLANPAVSDADIEQALSDVGVWLPHTQLVEGVETRLTTQRLNAIPIALRQCISLARAFVTQGKIYLLDMPSGPLNTFEKQSLFDKIEELKGQATVIIATDDDELIARCDRAVYLKAGVVAFDNSAEAFLKAKNGQKRAAG